MKELHAKMTFRLVFISFLALILIGCGESGTPGGDSGLGVTASIDLTVGDDNLPADGLTSTTITAVLMDSVNAPVLERTSVVFRTTRGKFKNGSTEYKVQTSDDSGTVTVTLISDGIPGTAEVSVESNKITQKAEIKFFDPTKVGTITLRTGSASITADGSSQVSVIATVTDALGNPEEGATVHFKTSLGQFVEANPLPGVINRTTTALTDVDGEAAVMLTSGKTIGTATIIASINGLNTSATVIFTADVPKTITLRAAPSTVRPEGDSTLFAMLKDINGNPVEGETIVFSQTVNASGGTLNTLSTPSNVNGEAQVTYTAGNDQGTDMLQAAWAGDLDMKADVTIVVDPSAIVVNSIDVTAGSPTIVADGMSEVNIRAIVTDIDGNPAIGKTVTFSTTAGTFDDSNLSTATATTSDIGMAEVKLKSTTIAGPVTVRAESDGFMDETLVDFVPGPADHILMYAFPDTVPPNGPFQTVAIIQDQYDNRIDDQRLMLQVRLAGNTEIVDTAEMTPDQAEDGVFRFDWTAATAYGTGDLEVTASVNNGVSKTVTIVVDETATIVGSISVEAGAEEIKADGSSSVLIRATVLDYNGDPASGITVDFSTTLGNLSTTSKETDANGIADVMLRSGINWGTATVTADANGFFDRVDVRFSSLKASGVSLTAMPGTVAPGEEATVIAELRDAKGAPVPNEVLYFDIFENNTNATLDAIQKTTDTNGRVTVTYTAGVSIADLCTNCACSGDRIRVTQASDSTIVDITCIEVAVPSGIAGYITLTAGADTLPADGASSTPITTTVFDTAGFAMPEGTEITISTTLGTFPGGVDPDGISGPINSEITLTTTDDTGKIIISLIASETDTGIATITATSGGVSQTVQVIMESILIPAGQYLSISSSKTSIKTNGTDFATITALVLDENHVPIEGATVNFSTDNGQISASSVKTDENGQASITLKSGPDKTNGTVTVTARVGASLQASVPVVLYGTEITITPSSAQLSVGLVPDPDTQEIVVKATDADGDPIYNATVAITFNAGTSDATLSRSGNLTTNYAGEIDLVLTAGFVTGTATVTAEAFNTDVTGTYTLGATASIFEITDPDTSPYPAPADGGTVAVTVHAGGLTAGDNVVFKTSFGTWVLTDPPVAPVVSNDPPTVSIDVGLNATLNLFSFQSGVATVQVYAEDTDTYPTLVDTIQISFYTPASQAYDIIIDASQTNIQPSTSTSQYSLGIEAQVVDIYGNPVGGAIVDFYLSNTTGGGEYIDPVSDVSDASGIARTTFTSGTISTGSDPGSAVLVTARVQTPMACTDEITEITTVDDVAGNLNDTYFVLNQTTGVYHVWYDVAGGGSYTPVGATGIQVAIDTNATAYEVAAATEEAVDAVAGFNTYLPVPVDEVTLIQCLADDADDLDATYFTISQLGTDYYVWYNTSGGGAGDPGPVGTATAIQVDIDTDADANVVADRTRIALAAAGFTVTRSGNILTVTTPGDVTNANDVNTGFPILVTTEGTDINPPLEVTVCGDVTDADNGASSPGFSFDVTLQGTNPTWQEDTLPIVITGGVANVSIGYGSLISSSTDATLYLQPVSVLVADTNGNPVSGALVSLGLKPSKFSTGYWEKVGNEWEIIYENPCPASSSTKPYIFVNEDLNNNAYLDGDEDQLNAYGVGDPDLPIYFVGYTSGSRVPGLGNGMLTPGQSVAGTLPASATTGDNGVVSFILTYQKEYAVWVEDQISATVMVFGTEYITKSRKWLGYMKDEEEDIANVFPTSPFNSLACGIAGP